VLRTQQKIEREGRRLTLRRKVHDASHTWVLAKPDDGTLKGILIEPQTGWNEQHEIAIGLSRQSRCPWDLEDYRRVRVSAKGFPKIAHRRGAPRDRQLLCTSRHRQNAREA
jgi:hypothetical protein